MHMAVTTAIVAYTRRLTSANSRENTECGTFVCCVFVLNQSNALLRIRWGFLLFYFIFHTNADVLKIKYFKVMQIWACILIC